MALELSSSELRDGSSPKLHCFHLTPDFITPTGKSNQFVGLNISTFLTNPLHTNSSSVTLSSKDSIRAEPVAMTPTHLGESVLFSAQICPYPFSNKETASGGALTLTCKRCAVAFPIPLPARRSPRRAPPR